MKRRLAALTMTGVLAVSMLAGCSTSSKTDGQVNQTETAGDTKSADGSKAENGEADSNSGETPVVKWYVFGDKCRIMT